VRLLHWSKRALIASIVVWAGLVLVYTTLGFAQIEVLRAPYNVMLMLLVATVTGGAGACLLTGIILAHLAAAKEESGARDGRLYFEMARIRGEVSQLRDLIESTMDLRRQPALALVGTAAVEPLSVDPEVVDLSRRIHRRMIEDDPA
jgi:hypothetical protein